MASKYASLPDIDSAPDVYETPDVPLESTQALDSDSDSDLLPPRAGSPSSTRRGNQPFNSTGGVSPNDENIASDRLDTLEARKRFQGARFERGDATMSQRPPSRRLPSTSTYALGVSHSLKAQDGTESETTLERLRRLRFEITELEEEVRQEQAAKENREPEAGSAPLGEPTDAKGKKKQREVSPAVILQQLQMLRSDLGALQVDEDASDVLEGEGEKIDGSTGLKGKVSASSTLLSRLGGAALKSGGSSGTQAANTATTTSSTAATRANQGELEKRVAEIEKLVGANEADIDEAHPVPPPLLQTVSRLDHLLTLLTQPRHLDSISRRVKVLVSELERLHESRRKLGDTRPLNIALSGGMTVAVGVDSNKSAAPAIPLASATGGATASNSTTAAPLPPDALQKIDALFALLPRLDPLLPLTPRVLARLRSLSTLHSSTVEFGSTLAHLKEEVARLGEGEQGLKEVVERFGKNFEENEERMKANLQVMEKRVNEVVERLEAVSDDD